LAFVLKDRLTTQEYSNCNCQKLPTILSVMLCYTVLNSNNGCHSCLHLCY